MGGLIKNGVNKVVVIESWCECVCGFFFWVFGYGKFLFY
jgi:hypothetical protein